MFGYGLLSRGTKSAGASFWGVDPTRERAVFELPNRLSAGNYLEGQPQGKVVLGQKIAKSLGAAIGDELVAVVQAADGSLGNELFYVAGVFKTAGANIDRAAAVMHRDDFNRLFSTEDRVHEIALNANGHDGDIRYQGFRPFVGDRPHLLDPDGPLVVDPARSGRARQLDWILDDRGGGLERHFADHRCHRRRTLCHRGSQTIRDSC